MNWFAGIVVFVMVWWTSIFLILPWGLKRDERGIPNDPKLKHKILMTTGIAIIIWLIIYFSVTHSMINFRAMSEMMMRKDYGS